jgi:7,8-dihydropterin-6-yl-methyl-4-(beta-D-ribofuranosyl)aminobenzene 5'-phosphate synthase
VRAIEDSFSHAGAGDCYADPASQLHCHPISDRNAHPDRYRDSHARVGDRYAASHAYRHSDSDQDAHPDRPTLTPAPTATPTTVPSPTPTPEPTPTEVAEKPRPEPVEGLTITIVYDNNEYDERLKTAGGFSCLVERGDLTLLFDTGGDVPTLLSNMEVLELDPRDIDIIVLSHIHGDHVGGLTGILGVNQDTAVYLPRSFPASFKEQVKPHARVVEVHEPMEIAEGIYTTGELGAGIIEQSLVLVTGRGLVVITGCAHPGLVNIVAKAKEITGEEVYLVMGGFHLGGASQAAIEGIVEDFRELGVQKVAPCHCSGDLARSIFEREYGEDFIRVGIGSRLEIGE